MDRMLNRKPITRMRAMRRHCTVMASWCVITLLLVGAIPPLLMAQQPPNSGIPRTTSPVVNPGIPWPTGIGQPGASQQGVNTQGFNTREVEHFDSIWRVPETPQFNGFAPIASQMRIYGSYPRAGDSAGVGSVFMPLAPEMLEQPGWPAWVRT